MIRYSVWRQSEIEQHDMPVPGWSRLRNHGARAGFAFGGGAAIAGIAAPIIIVSPMARRLGLAASSLATARTPNLCRINPVAGTATLAPSAEPGRSERRDLDRRSAPGHEIGN